jgi:uncharacterized protein (TIGR03083 family)
MATDHHQLHDDQVRDDHAHDQGHHHTHDHDYHALGAAQKRRMSELIHSLSAEQWVHESLCAGWRVCDVVGHVTFGNSAPLPKVLGLVLFKYRGNVTKASAIESPKFADRLGQVGLIAEYDRSSVSPRGLGRLIKGPDLLGDNLVHELDIRRPLGIDGSFPPELIMAALDALVVTKSAFFAPAKNAVELSFEATDVHWHWGSGPSVQGPAEDLALALSGRAVGLDALHGDGVATLRDRLTSTS